MYSCTNVVLKPRQNNKSLIGKKFGRLTILEDTKKRYYGYVVYKCRCDCGNYTEAPSHNLKNGNVVSCGCKLQEIRDNWGQTAKQLWTEKPWIFRKDKPVKRKRKYKRVEGEDLSEVNCAN